MKLNTDCIREVMLQVEKEHIFTVTDDGLIVRYCFPADTLYEKLPQFTKEEIFYTVFNLEQAGYLDVDIQWAGGGIVFNCTINHMTYAGHEFLDRIRDPKHWSVIKGGLSAVRNYSLDAINAIASGITSAAISAYFENNPL